MLAKIFRHSIYPRVSLFAAKLAAAVRGQLAFRVLGENIEPTLSQGAICRYRRVAFNEQLIRGCVVAFTVPDFEGQVVPSRVIAFGGESIKISAGRLFINELSIEEPYVRSGFAREDYSTYLPEQLVPEGRYFLLGDYRDVSKDSRYLGPIQHAAILGVVTGHETADTKR